MNGSMASACATSRPAPIASAPSACPSSKKTAAAATRSRQRRTVSCRASGGGRGGDNDDGLLWLPRRDALLTGLSGTVAAGLAWYPGLAFGDDSPCDTADKVNEKVVVCTDASDVQKPCPLRSPADPVDFTPYSKVTRVRQAAHLLSRENQEKYKEAVAKMKALPESNPLSFKAQAAIHQAYCDSYYKYHKAVSSSASASEDDDPVFDVHFSWIFAPWHRMYIHFYEKALGDLIGDDTFALPFWNWDAPAGMVVPTLFKDQFANPLFDPNRNSANLDALVDLDYQNEQDKPAPIPFKGPKDQKYKELVNKNLCTIYAQQVRKGPESYLGEKYCTDLKKAKGAPGAGTLERMAHTAMHVWVGKSGPPAGKTCGPETGGVLNHSSKTKDSYNCKNDMGFLGSAGNDPLFYSHHSNVDRMWHLWSTRLGGGQGITDPDWLDTSFVFYDDVNNPRKVRIKFSDVVSTSNLGYTYDPEYDKDLPWLRPKITTLVPHGPGAAGAAARSAAKAPAFPVVLTKGQVVEVPGVALPAREPGKEQVLVIDGIEYDPQANTKFDVAINVPKDKALQVGPQYKEYAGSFSVVPGTGSGDTRTGKVALCITDVLFDIDAEDDSTVDVAIVPRTAAKVTLTARPTIKIRKT